LVSADKFRACRRIAVKEYDRGYLADEHWVVPWFAGAKLVF